MCVMVTGFTDRRIDRQADRESRGVEERCRSESGGVQLKEGKFFDKELAAVADQQRLC